MKKDKIASNFWKLNTSRFILSFAYIYIAVLFIFYQTAGLNLAQVGIVVGLSSISTLIFEIPTGIFADRYGRKKSLIMGALSQLIFPLMILLWPTFLGIAIASVFLGLGRSFQSGADIALLHDSNAQSKNKRLFKEVVGKYQACGLIAGSIALFSSGFIAEIDFRFIFIISAFFFILNMFFLISLKEPEKYYNKKSRENTTSLKHFIKSCKDLWNNKKVLVIAIYGLTVSTIIATIYRFHQIYANQVGITTHNIGIIFAGMYIIAAFTSFYIKKIEKGLGKKLFIFLMPIILGLSYFFMGSLFNSYGIFFVIMESIVAGISWPLVEELQNNHLIKKRRATTLSIISMAQELFIAIGVFIFGTLAESKSLASTYVSVGILVILSGMFLANKINNFKNKK